MGIGHARGDDRSVAAAEMAISSPLLEASIDGAHGVLLSIAGGSDLGLFEINEAAQLVSNAAAPDANIIFGAVIDDALGDEVRVTVIAAGFDEPVAGGQAGRPQPASRPQPGVPPGPAVLGDLPGPSDGAHGQGRAPSGAEGRATPPQPMRPVAAARPAAPAEAPPAQQQSHPVQPAPQAHSPAEHARAAPPRRSRTSPQVSIPRPAPEPSHAESISARVPDPARRRPVVFEEQEEELDVPDFLK